MARPKDPTIRLRFPEYLSGGAFLCDPITRNPDPVQDQTGGESNPSLSPFERGLERVVRAGLGQGVSSVAYPGGKGRASAILTLTDGREIVATLRDEPARTALEHEALTRLHTQGAPAAQSLHFNGVTLLQECLPGERLAEYIRHDPKAAWPALASALDSLGDLHEKGSAAGLDAFGPILGASLDWLEALLARPGILGEYLNVPAPKCDLDRQVDLLTCYSPRFVKWDARGGNAMRASDGAIAWFDFEHCGARNRLDDLVWLLADETVPDNALAEETLLDIAIERFADGRSADEARAYVYSMGMFHAAVRLGIILYQKGDEPWQKPGEALAEDKLPVSVGHAMTLARRGARWADKADATRPFASWWQRVEQALARLDRAPPRKAGKGKARKRSLV